MLTLHKVCVLLLGMLRQAAAVQPSVSANRGSGRFDFNFDTDLDLTNWTGKANEDLFMRYMPDRNLVICGCGKCGSTSMYGYIYTQLHGHSFQDEHGPAGPYVQEVFSKRWKDAFQLVLDNDTQDALMKSEFSFALIRDPKERIISAWKSKVACSDGFQTDQDDRNEFVPAVLRLANRWGNKATCLDLTTFVEYLRDIQQLGRAQYLDRHFLPQNHGCFRRFPPEKWSKVTPIGAPGAFAELANVLGSKDGTAPESHSSEAKLLVTKSLAKLLDEVTADEYAMLSAYLPPSSIKEGSLV